MGHSYSRIMYKFLASERSENDPKYYYTDTQYVHAIKEPISFEEYKLSKITFVSWKDTLYAIFVPLLAAICMIVPILAVPVFTPKPGEFVSNLSYSIVFIGLCAVFSTGVFMAWTWPFIGRFIQKLGLEGQLTEDQMKRFRLNENGDIPASWRYYICTLPFPVVSIILYTLLPLSKYYPIPFQILIAGLAYGLILPPCFYFSFPKFVRAAPEFFAAMKNIMLMVILTSGLWFTCIGYILAFSSINSAVGQAAFGVAFHVLLSSWEKIIRLVNAKTPARYHGLISWWTQFVGNMFFLLAFPDVKSITAFVLLQLLKIVMAFGAVFQMSHLYWDWRIWIISKVNPLWRLSVFVMSRTALDSPKIPRHIRHSVSVYIKSEIEDNSNPLVRGSITMDKPPDLALSDIEFPEIRNSHTIIDGSSERELTLSPYHTYKIMQARLFVYAYLTDLITAIIFVSSWVFFRYGWNRQSYPAYFMCYSEFNQSWLFAVIQLLIMTIAFVICNQITKRVYKFSLLDVSVPQLKQHIATVIMMMGEAVPFAYMMIIFHDKVTSFMTPHKYEANFGGCKVGFL